MMITRGPLRQSGSTDRKEFAALRFRLGMQNVWGLPPRVRKTEYVVKAHFRFHPDWRCVLSFKTSSSAPARGADYKGSSVQLEKGGECLGLMPCLLIRIRL